MMIWYEKWLRNFMIIIHQLLIVVYMPALHYTSHTLNLRIILLNPNKHYNHGFPNTFDYNHYVYSDYLVCSVPDIAHIIRY